MDRYTRLEYELKSQRLKNFGFSIKLKMRDDGTVGVYGIPPEGRAVLGLYYTQTLYARHYYVHTIEKQGKNVVSLPGIAAVSEYINIDSLVLLNACINKIDYLICAADDDEVDALLGYEYGKEPLTNISQRHKKSKEAFRKHWNLTLTTLNKRLDTHFRNCKEPLDFYFKVGYGEGFDEHAFKVFIITDDNKAFEVTEGSNPIKALCNVRYAKSNNKQVRKIINQFNDMDILWRVSLALDGTFVHVNYEANEAFLKIFDHKNKESQSE